MKEGDVKGASPHNVAFGVDYAEFRAGSLSWLGNPRVQFEVAFYHAMSRAHGSRDIFQEDKDRKMSF
jgi:hypothetical protein